MERHRLRPFGSARAARDGSRRGAASGAQAAETVAPSARAATDALIDAYVTWREACAHVRVAYEGCCASGPAECEPAFVTYWAALRCEEYAAEGYALQVGLVQRLLGPGAADRSRTG
jgi:hypothetical protein